MERLERLASAVADHAGLELMVLHGSRATAEASVHSDWDLGYLASAELDVGALLQDVVLALGTDRVDLADLDRASGLLRFRAARDGQVVFEAKPGAFKDFASAVATTWLDMEAVVRRAHADVLAGLDR